MTAATAPKIGHNNPPSPFDDIKAEIEALHEEARGWLDGEPVASQGQADALDKLKGMIRDAEKKAENLRKAEVKPFDDGKAAVQARRSEEHTSDIQSLMRISYAVVCLKKKN